MTLGMARNTIKMREAFSGFFVRGIWLYKKPHWDSGVLGRALNSALRGHPWEHAL